MKKKNDLVPAKPDNGDSDFSLSFPDGEGSFKKGIDRRGNHFEKRDYTDGRSVKVEELHSGHIKLTAKIPNPKKK
ncbi:hypothetical protein [Ruminococcus sp.]|uniref:hypothetical protein n=1 Tax=Ruminococcus sp. TaxID=41978 RepID=UPI0025EC6A42|nr:hypothetical protein [Ruminococcus sp.]MBR1432198.1 hypothetical protein [Ruminococcus sp.]